MEFPAGQCWATVRTPTHCDVVLDNEYVAPGLSDPEIHGAGTVWDQSIWTDWWRIQGSARHEDTVRIRNVAPAGTFKRGP